MQTFANETLRLAEKAMTAYSQGDLVTYKAYMTEIDLITSGKLARVPARQNIIDIADSLDAEIVAA